jgi:hypothetical protein
MKTKIKTEARSSYTPPRKKRRDKDYLRLRGYTSRKQILPGSHKITTGSINTSDVLAILYMYVFKRNIHIYKFLCTVVPSRTGHTCIRVRCSRRARLLIIGIHTPSVGHCDFIFP